MTENTMSKMSLFELPLRSNKSRPSSSLAPIHVSLMSSALNMITCFVKTRSGRLWIEIQQAGMFSTLIHSILRQGKYETKHAQSRRIIPSFGLLFDDLLCDRRLVYSRAVGISGRHRPLCSPKYLDSLYGLAVRPSHSSSRDRFFAMRDIRQDRDRADIHHHYDSRGNSSSVQILW
jgi:hypothetical protein